MELTRNAGKLMELGIDLIFPRRCPVCDEPVGYGKGNICGGCRKSLKYVQPPFCMQCGKSIEKETEEYCHDCRENHHYYMQGASIYEYSSISESIYRFKYKGRREYGKFYGEEICRVLGSRIRSWNPDALVPVPVHKSRERNRGYNQAGILAQEMGGMLGLPVEKDLILRCRMTKPQKELSRGERQNNLKKAFKMCKNDVKLNTIVIIDDIYTTGTTIDSMTLELLRAGIENIYFVTLAVGHGL